MWWVVCCDLLVLLFLEWFWLNWGSKMFVWCLVLKLLYVGDWFFLMI